MRTGEYPAALTDLRATTLPALVDPAGQPYTYEAARGTVSLAGDSPLSPLPRTFGRR